MSGKSDHNCGCPASCGGACEGDFGGGARSNGFARPPGDGLSVLNGHRRIAIVDLDGREEEAASLVRAAAMVARLHNESYERVANNIARAYETWMAMCEPVCGERSRELEPHSPVRCLIASNNPMSRFARQFHWPVGQLEQSDGGRATCFIISDDLILTAGHVARRFVVGRGGGVWEPHEGMKVWLLQDGAPDFCPAPPTDEGRELLGPISRTDAHFRIIEEIEWEVSAEVDYAILRCEVRVGSSNGFGRLQLRCWDTSQGQHMNMLSHPLETSLALSRGRIAFTSASCEVFYGTNLEAGIGGIDLGVATVNSGGCMEGSLASLPGSSGGPWLDDDGCARGVNRSGWREVIPSSTRSLATRLHRIMRRSPTVRRVVASQAPRARQCWPTTFISRADPNVAFEYVIYRDSDSGHVMAFVSLLDEQWAHVDLTVSDGLPHAARHSRFVSWNDDEGAALIAVVSSTGDSLQVWRSVADYSAYTGNRWQRTGVIGLRRRTHAAACAVAAHPQGNRAAVFLALEDSSLVFIEIRDGVPQQAVPIRNDVDLLPRSCLAAWIDESDGHWHVIYRDTAGAVGHVEHTGNAWERRRNLPIQRDYLDVAVATTYLSSSACGLNDVAGRAYLVAQMEGAEERLTVVLRWWHENDHWSVERELSVSAPAPTPVSVGCTVNHRWDPIASRATCQMFFSYITDGGLEYTLYELYGNSWHPRRHPRQDDDDYGFIRIGSSSGSGRQCVLTGGYLVGWLVIRGECVSYRLSSRTGLPIGWSYHPRREDRPSAPE